MANHHRETEKSDAGPREFRGWIFRIALFLASVAVAFLLFEIILRLIDEPPWYERLVEEQQSFETPFFQVGERKYKVRRPLEDVVPPDPDAYRILFLGDSFTYGLGVEAEEALFPALVTRALDQKAGESWPNRFEFYNGGIPGSLTGDWIGLYRESIDLFDPNLVVAVFFLRDGTRTSGSVSGLREIRQAMNRLGRESFLFRNSRLYRLVVENQKQQEFGQRYFESMKNEYLGPVEETREWKFARRRLLLMRNETVERGGKFAIVIFPVLFGLSGDYPLQEVMDEIERFGNVNGIPTLSLLPAFQGEDPSTLWVSALDQHPNERAHAIAAESITGFLVEEIQSTGDRSIRD